jgi:putative sigma-54 modulation protein
MEIEVRASNVAVSEALETHILRRIDSALRRFAPRVARVVVRLVDLNGPKGGLDKRCRITAELCSPAPGMIVEATDADAYVAVSQAAARLDERVTRVLARRRSRSASTRAVVRRLRGRAPIETEANEPA